MTDERLQQHRRARLESLLNHSDFNGNKARLGEALGYKSGAFVRQMIDGERAVSEKTVATIETIRGGKFKGWFDTYPPAADLQALVAGEPPPLSARLQQLLDDLSDLHPARQSKIIDMVHQEAEDARAAADHLARKRLTTMAASKPSRASSSLAIRLGDGNPNQGTLPLTTVPDPFTAEPTTRERVLYQNFERSKERHPK